MKPLRLVALLLVGIGPASARGQYPSSQPYSFAYAGAMRVPANAYRVPQRTQPQPSLPLCAGVADALAHVAAGPEHRARPEQPLAPPRGVAPAPQSIQPPPEQKNDPFLAYDGAEKLDKSIRPAKVLVATTLPIAPAARNDPTPLNPHEIVALRPASSCPLRPSSAPDRIAAPATARLPSATGTMTICTRTGSPRGAAASSS